MNPQPPTQQGFAEPIKCPDCGMDTIQDHNSFRCIQCEKLWPKGHGHEKPPTPPQSDTPRTDANMNQHDSETTYGVDAAFARQLERELARLKSAPGEIKMAEEWSQNYYANFVTDSGYKTAPSVAWIESIQQNAQAAERAECEKEFEKTFAELQSQINEFIGQEKELTELRKDKERLDWFNEWYVQFRHVVLPDDDEMGGTHDECCFRDSEPNADVRLAIDAAMKK